MSDFLEYMKATQVALDRVISKGIESPDQETREECKELLQLQWDAAMMIWRQYGNRDLVDSLLAKGWSPPAEVTVELLDPPRRRGRPPKVGAGPEQVVKLVRMASLLGHQYSGGQADDNPAFVQVARLLGCHPEHVARLYKKVPRERREELRVSAQWIHEQLGPKVKGT